VIVALRAAMIAETAYARCDVRITGGDTACIAKSTEILGGIKAETGRKAETSGTLATPSRTKCLSGVFEKLELVLSGYLGEAIHPDALSVEMYRENCACTDGGVLEVVCDFVGVEIERCGVDVDEDWTGSAANDGACGCEETEWRGDDVIAGTNAGSLHSKPEGVGTGGAGNGFRDAEVGRDLALQGGGLFSQDELLGFADTSDGFLDFGSNGGVLPLEVEHRNRGVGRILESWIAHRFISGEPRF